MILLRRFGTIRVFATDLDKPTAADPCTDGGCGDHRSSGRPHRPRAPRRALRTRTGTSNCTSRGRNAPFESRMHISTSTGPTRPRQPRTAPARATPRRPRPADHDSRREGLSELGDDVKGSTASPSRWGSTPRVEGRACRRRGSSSVGCALRGWRGVEVLTVRHLTEHPTKGIHPAILHHP